MSAELFLRQTRERFPHFHEVDGEISPIEKGGSDRQYYRVQFGAHHSLILVKYNVGKDENARFVGIAKFLVSVGINAPLIHYHDPVEGLIWMQDLGDKDLWSYRKESWPVRRLLYETTLNQIGRLHGVDP